MIQNDNIALDAYIDPAKIALSSKIGTTYYVAKSDSTIYDYLVDRLAPDAGLLFTTITAGCAALSSYDTLIIAPGNYDEAGTITLTSLKQVTIKGMNTGFQWGEGSTCWRDVTSTADLLAITGCQALEISNIAFIVVTDGKDAINFTGLNYSTHIHDCSFVGDVGSGAVMAYGVNAAGSNGPDTYIHDCRFFRVKTTAIVAGNQRNVIKNNYFVVPAAGYGITITEQSTGFNLIADNYFLGANSTDIGIVVSNPAAGYAMYTHNWFANLSSEIETSVDENCVENYFADASTGGGVAAAANPEE